MDTSESGALITTQPTDNRIVAIDRLTREQIELVKRTVAKGATDDELRLFLMLAERYQLDPFRHEIWHIKYPPKTRSDGTIHQEPAIIITGRDGLLKIAMRDPGYAGVQAYVVKDGDEFEIDTDSGHVRHTYKVTAERRTAVILGAWARALHKDRAPVVAFVDMAEYERDNAQWKQFPSAMIQKVAEAFVLRRQYNITGMVTAEEIDLNTYGAPAATDRTRNISPPSQTAPKFTFRCAKCPKNNNQIKGVRIGNKSYTALQVAQISMKEHDQELCAHHFKLANDAKKASAAQAPAPEVIDGKATPVDTPAPPATPEAPAAPPEPTPITTLYQQLADLWHQATGMGVWNRSLVFPALEEDVYSAMAELRGVIEEAEAGLPFEPPSEEPEEPTEDPS